MTTEVTTFYTHADHHHPKYCCSTLEGPSCCAHIRCEMKSVPVYQETDYPTQDGAVSARSSPWQLASASPQKKGTTAGWHYILQCSKVKTATNDGSLEAIQSVFRLKRALLYSCANDVESSAQAVRSSSHQPRGACSTQMATLLPACDLSERVCFAAGPPLFVANLL